MHSTSWLPFLIVALVPPNETHGRTIARYRSGERDLLFGSPIRPSRNATPAQIRTRRCSTCDRYSLDFSQFTVTTTTAKPCTQEPCKRFSLDFSSFRPETRPETTTTTTTTTTSTTTPKPYQGADLDKYKDTCGIRFTDPDGRYILDGVLVQPGEWTFTVGLIIRRESHPWCGGTLITDRHVITAAHCLQELTGPADVRVRAGHYDTDAANPADDSEVEEMIIHEGYIPETFDADIAILKLRRALTLSWRISVACLPDERDHSGATATVMGWGFTDPETTIASQRLQQVNVSVLTNAECAHQHRNFKKRITPNMVCAGRRNTLGFDSCQGDSGGPLVMENQRTRRFFLEGVVSWGEGCGNENVAGVYTRVSKFVLWIYANVY